MNALILVVEDDNDINHMLTELLQQNCYRVRSAYSGTEALLCMEKEVPDVVLLDLMLPGMPGDEVLLKIKEASDKPSVIAVSAKDDSATKIKLLRTGADDYVTKPFDTEELLARIEVVLRRNHTDRVSSKGIIQYKDILLNPDTMEVFLGNQPVNLTKREFMILELLMSSPNKVFSKNNIFESVWNEEFLGEDNAVNVHISNIRQKLSKINPDETYIQTVWGIGFKMK